jgi:hypothetical protein
MNSKNELSCSFCSKSQNEIRKLISGPQVYICDECIFLCNGIIVAALEKDANEDTNSPIIKAAEIFQGTDLQNISVPELSEIVHKKWEEIICERKKQAQSLEEIKRNEAEAQLKLKIATEELAAATKKFEEASARLKKAEKNFL